MNVFWTLARREFAGYFSGATGFLLLSAVLFLLGLGLVVVLTGLNGEATPMPVTQVFYSTYFFWVILLLISPIITMRTFAMEKATGTFETLMSAPIGDWQVVMAKFTGALLFFVTAWMPLLACSLVVRYYVGDSAALGWGVATTTLLGILLIGCLYMSMGCLASVLTNNPAVAAVSAFALGTGLFFAGFLGMIPGGEDNWKSMAIKQISMSLHMEEFVRGVIDFKSVVFFLSLTVLFLYMTHKAIESRRWR